MVEVSKKSCIFAADFDELNQLRCLGGGIGRRVGLKNR